MKEKQRQDEEGKTSQADVSATSLDFSYQPNVEIILLGWTHQISILVSCTKRIEILD